MFFYLLLVSVVLLIYFLYTKFCIPIAVFKKYGISHVSLFEALQNVMNITGRRMVFFEAAKEMYNKFPGAR